MAAKKLFWRDTSQTELESTVTSVEGEDITVAETIFYAFSGGQESDCGTIGGFEVLNARKEGDEIVYTLPPAHSLRVGDSVEIRVDGERRLRVMRLHFAAELVLELVYQHYGRPEKIGANITWQKARVDFRWEGNISSIFPDLQEKLQKLIGDDLPITSAFSDEQTGRRYWEIAGFAKVPCGGTHPKSTGALGALVLRREHLGHGKERIEIRLA